MRRPRYQEVDAMLLVVVKVYREAIVSFGCMPANLISYNHRPRPLPPDYFANVLSSYRLPCNAHAGVGPSRL